MHEEEAKGSREYKLKAVKKVVRVGMSYREGARDLGIRDNLIRNCRNSYSTRFRGLARFCRVLRMIAADGSKWGRGGSGDDDVVGCLGTARANDRFAQLLAHVLFGLRQCLPDN